MTTISLSSRCVCRKKRGYRRSATSWLSDRLYATAADPPQARIRTTTPRRPHPSLILSLCFPRPAIPTLPRTIPPSRLPSPTPPTSTRPTARWAATTVTTARSHCCINRRGMGTGVGVGGGAVAQCTRGTQNTRRHCDFHLYRRWAQRCSDTVLKCGVEAQISTQECFTLGSFGESHAGNTRPHSFDLTVFNPATTRRRHISD